MDCLASQHSDRFANASLLDIYYSPFELYIRVSRSVAKVLDLVSLLVVRCSSAVVHLILFSALARISTLASWQVKFFWQVKNCQKSCRSSSPKLEQQWNSK